MEIPLYPQSRPLEIGDKELLDALFQELQPRVSELTFAGLYLFRKAHRYSLTRVSGTTVVLGVGYDSQPYFLPPLDGNIEAALGQLFSDRVAMYGADEGFVSRFLGGTHLTVLEDRDSFDYLYLREELATLSGNRFHGKKNRINYFIGRHEYRTELFEQRFVPGALELLEAWSRPPAEGAGASRQLEIEATAEALEKADLLGLSGVVVTVQGVVRAFVLGERLNRETVVCHFEKSDPFMEGISQLVNREFCRLLFEECRYVNREQDLGEPGLRTAKLSYRPVELVKKYRVVPAHLK